MTNAMEVWEAHQRNEFCGDDQCNDCQRAKRRRSLTSKSFLSKAASSPRS